MLCNLVVKKKLHILKTCFSLSKEELDVKYERILICSLNGYALYLSKVSMEQIKKYENIHKEILSSPKFWKLSKYKAPGVSK